MTVSIIAATSPSSHAATDVLWSPTRLGRIGLAHRVAMAPMTRSRATGDGLVTDLTRTYYAQRASLAMLITEGTQPSEDGQGYLATPGIHTARAGARPGVGSPTPCTRPARRSSCSSCTSAGCRTPPTPRTAGHRSHRRPSRRSGDMFTATGPQPMAVPREMTEADIAQTIADFRRAARLAVDAGADGVELHGANGYLLQQFMSTNANRRTDGYGGDIAGRIRFPVEVATAVADEIGADRVGYPHQPRQPAR